MPYHVIVRPIVAPLLCDVTSLPQVPLDKLTKESDSYGLVFTDFVRPPWIHVGNRSDVACTNSDALFKQVEGYMFCMGTLLTSPKACPESFTTTDPGCRLPPMNSEGKTLDAIAYRELASYVGAAMRQSHFQIRKKDFPGCDLRTSLFFKTPPYGYGMVFVGGMACLCSVEMVGCLFIAPVCRPVFLTSADHEHLLTDLVRPVETEIAFALSRTAVRYCDYTCRGAAWTRKPVGLGELANRFVKVIPYSDYEVVFFLHIHSVYGRLAAARAAGGTPMRHVLEARLTYGYFEVAVDMPFVVGTKPDVRDAECLVACAEAIADLFCRGMLYTDLNARNIRKDREGQVWLLDYDDILLVDDAIDVREKWDVAMRSRSAGSVREVFEAAKYSYNPGLLATKYIDDYGTANSHENAVWDAIAAALAALPS